MATISDEELRELELKENELLGKIHQIIDIRRAEDAKYRDDRKTKEEVEANLSAVSEAIDLTKVVL